MSFKQFIKKAERGEITGSDVSRIVHVRVPSAEGFARTIDGHEAPAYRTTIELPTSDQRAAVERAMSAVD